MSPTSDQTAVNQQAGKERIKDFSVGDGVNVHFKIREGDKERIQLFSGTVIAKGGSGSATTFTVRRVAHGTGVERVFPLHSPLLEKVEVESLGKVRRAKLYYLRKRSAKEGRVKERETAGQ